VNWDDDDWLDLNAEGLSQLTWKELVILVVVVLALVGVLVLIAGGVK
jgi:hypothetical protein